MMFYAIAEDKPNGKVLHFVSGLSIQEVALQAGEGQIVVPFDGEPATGGLIQGGVVIFPPPSSAEIEEKKWAAIKRTRDNLTNEKAWTYRSDSPLSQACQAKWLAWSQKLNRMTVDFATADSVVWPDLPSQEY